VASEARSRMPAIRARLAIAKRELASLKSEKTIVLALLIQLFVAAFSSFLVVGLVSMYDPGSSEGFTVDAGVVGEDAGDLSIVLSEEDGVAPRSFGSQSQAEAAFQNGEIDAILITHAVEEGPDASAVQVEAIVAEGSIRTTMTVVQLQSALKAYERSERLDRIQYLDRRPLSLPDRIAASPYFGFTYTILIPLLMFLPVFISGSIAVDSLTEELQRGTLELLRVAPITTWDIVDAKLIATATLAPIQAAAWLVLLTLNGITIANPVAIVAVVAGLSLAVVVVGLSLSLLAPDRRQAQFLYSTGVLAIVSLTTLLPEHPANTIARLAIGSPGSSTWVAVLGYLAIGVGAYLVIRAAVARVDLEGIE
jgi:ABC-2 type transport system permease protein